MVTETPTEKCERLAAVTSSFTLKPVGLSECGCPNNIKGNSPVLHICRICGYEGSATLHITCPGCQYLRSRTDGTVLICKLHGDEEYAQ